VKGTILHATAALSILPVDEHPLVVPCLVWVLFGVAEPAIPLGLLR
jgi:hypothetical protein